MDNTKGQTMEPIKNTLALGGNTGALNEYWAPVVCETLQSKAPKEDFPQTNRQRVNGDHVRQLWAGQMRNNSGMKFAVNASPLLEVWLLRLSTAKTHRSSMCTRSLGAVRYNSHPSQAAM